MRIRYIGAEASTETFGKTFHRSKWVNVGDMDVYAQSTLAQNPQFETEAVIDGDAPSGDALDTDPVV